jgi:hypothetical protein
MTDPVNDAKNQTQIDTRANLFYFLQSLPGPEEDKGHQPGAESSAADEQSQAHQHGKG